MVLIICVLKSSIHQEEILISKCRTPLATLRSSVVQNIVRIDRLNGTDNFVINKVTSLRHISNTAHLPCQQQTSCE